MRCPSCGHPESKVIDSRDLDEGKAIRRRRECLKCGSRFTTYERIEATNFFVIKKDGRREKFSRDKLRAGIEKACEKRPISSDQIEHLITGIERELGAGAEMEIPSARIGELVMERLRELDEVAYIRFASVYRSFADLATFEKELRTMLKQKK